MPSEILPITNPNPRSQPLLSSESPKLLGSEDDISPTTRLLISNFDDYKKNESEPFLPKSSSFSAVLASGITPDLENGIVGVDSKSYSQQQRRRRVASDGCLTSLSGAGVGNGEQPFPQEFGPSASDTCLITRLSFKLLRYLGVGYRWIMKFVALGCYSFLLFPGFVQVGYYYFFSRQVRRGIVYGDQPRNRLDLYMPKDSKGSKPVIAFVTGGAWIIGYKAWGSLLGHQLSERDIIVACIDYRNFPQGTMGDMIKDASQGISFICNNIAEYGGDPNRIYLMGQSAGAHIGACALVEQASKEAGEGEKPSWSVSQIKAYFGLSGGYNLLNLVDYFHSRGLYRRLFLSIMEGEESLARYSPELRVGEPNYRNVTSLLPRIVLFHGTGDYSIPCDSSESFAETLRGLGVNAESIMYEGKTHTDLFLQDPMRGGRDQMFEDLVGIIHEGDEEAIAKDSKAPPRKRMVPEFMLQWARSVSPF